MMDFINAGFNWVAALFTLLNALDIRRKKDVAGHTFPSAIFFFLWAAFSIPYFWGLEQYWSVVPNIAIFITNGFLLAMVIIYRKIGAR
jgi:hypothetical protein